MAKSSQPVFHIESSRSVHTSICCHSYTIELVWWCHAAGASITEGVNWLVRHRNRTQFEMSLNLSVLDEHAIFISVCECALVTFTPFLFGPELHISSMRRFQSALWLHFRVLTNTFGMLQLTEVPKTECLSLDTQKTRNSCRNVTVKNYYYSHG